MLSHKGFFKTFINLFVYIYNIKVQLWIYLEFMIFITYIFLQNKWNLIDIVYNSNFA
jgi:hypothetical protein